MRSFRMTFLLFALCTAALAQQAMNNDGVTKLVKAGMSDDLIITTINASPGNYDTSADALTTLKTSGVSDKVIAAILSKAHPIASSHSPEPSASSGIQGSPRIFIDADPKIGVAIAAAFSKKHVPATIVTDMKEADYILKSAPVAAKQESAGSKFARCMFAYCAGIEGMSSVSVQLIKPADDSVLWAYQVRKGNGGPGGLQSLSEAIAKHLKNDFLEKQKR